MGCGFIGKPGEQFAGSGIDDEKENELIIFINNSVVAERSPEVHAIFTKL